MTELLDMKTAREHLGISKSQLHKLINSGLVECQKVDGQKLVSFAGVRRAKSWLDGLITVAEAAERTGVSAERIAYLIGCDLYIPAMRDQADGLKDHRRIEEILREPAGRRVLIEPADLQQLKAVAEQHSWEPVKAEFVDLLQGHGIACSTGWRPMLEEMLGRVRELVEDPRLFKVRQIKEKLAGLRFYYDYDGDAAVADQIRDVIAEYEDRSYSVCEVCGAAGEMRTGGYLQTLCDHHAAIPTETEIVRNPEIMSGEPTVSGTRVPAMTIVAYLRVGRPPEEVFADYPTLPPDGIDAVIAWAEAELGPKWRDQR